MLDSYSHNWSFVSTLWPVHILCPFSWRIVCLFLRDLQEVSDITDIVTALKLCPGNVSSWWLVTQSSFWHMYNWWSSGRARRKAGLCVVLLVLLFFIQDVNAKIMKKKKTMENFMFYYPIKVQETTTYWFLS